MDPASIPVLDLLVLALLLAGIMLFRTPRGARVGNWSAAAALLLAAGLVAARHPPAAPWLVGGAVLVGAAAGVWVALRTTMIRVPALVAFQHGAGGMAALAVAAVELGRTGPQTGAVEHLAALLGLVIGAATFGGSMLAAGKLAGRLSQAPRALPRHDLVLVALAVAIAALCAAAGAPAGPAVLAALAVLAVALGLAFAMRIGGADMPVLISFLNATAGLAAGFCGIALENRLLVACGATVAASGSILTAVMCRAMNRGLSKVFTGSIAQAAPATPAAAVPAPAAGPAAASASAPAAAAPVRSAEQALAQAREALGAAGRVVIIPGYGMAVAQAQFQVAALARRLEEKGKQVKFAIHPVAGRMPGHMNVLLAEAEVDYDKLREMDEVNPEFASTDLALVVGACDVVNPAANQTDGNPISGMPILNAHEARRVLVCNLDDRPGYSGVRNPLYASERTLLLLGDAGRTMDALLEGL